ncbi:hypothetical protein CHELA40_10255 [Chelatococcus asaccharovorans]|nr:hypothetical protein CHELA40_10255 [Chelatococcus asaccharovorans]
MTSPKRLEGEAKKEKAARRRPVFDGKWGGPEGPGPDVRIYPILYPHGGALSFIPRV